MHFYNQLLKNMPSHKIQESADIPDLPKDLVYFYNLFKQFAYYGLSICEVLSLMNIISAIHPSALPTYAYPRHRRWIFRGIR